MKDFQLSKHNINLLFEVLTTELETAPLIVVSSQNASTGKWGMARLWRAWMSSTAKWMAKNGATMPLCLDKEGKNYGTRPFNASDSHELFTAQWLFVDGEGTRLSWAKDPHDGMRTATKGERFMGMVRHEQWALERGIMLFKPRDSEYSELENEDNEIINQKG